MPSEGASIWNDIFNLDAPGWTTGKVRNLITEEANRQGVDPALALSLAHQESGFNPEATSPTGVVGLFQVTNKTGAGYGQTPGTRRDPVTSTRAGLAYFKDLLAETGGDVRKALTQVGRARRLACRRARAMPSTLSGLSES